MKRLILVTLILTAFASGFSSCKKCYSCNFSAGQTRELCTKDFPDGNEGLKMTIDAYKQQGYECTAK